MAVSMSSKLPWNGNKLIAKPISKTPKYCERGTLTQIKNIGTDNKANFRNSLANVSMKIPNNVDNMHMAVEPIT